jgi:hypothetical protein
MLKFMQQGTTVMSEAYFAQNTKKTAYGHLEQKAWNADTWCNAALAQALLEHFNWDCLTTLLTVVILLLATTTCFTCLKNRL